MGDRAHLGSGQVLWQEGEAGADGTFGPWTVRWSIDEPPSIDIAQTFRAEGSIGSYGEINQHV